MLQYADNNLSKEARGKNQEAGKRVPITPIDFYLDS